ncbi:DoxX family protein [Aliiroseovarius crassostreae]|uniref:DoxX family protein n=1 Tax=Aliiroseovarius crassostreae TaxID=154981 RepID=UPI0022015A3C|nr:DoxX family protein [Aliiroseovarius crassostreae]UWP89152.1 DoxX family protein [Aliiroseovarius crassostreae]UWQ01794.1 DoxX family protein [Aliiroseovarius crassostreae]UWQ04914.1 DoxX family protein [Aliiroseovarius crassostreae]
MSLITVFVGLLSVFFLFASSIKILGWQKLIFETQLAMFRKYGLNRQIMMLVGLAELFGAIAIWLQGSWLGTLGALALLGTSVGAIGCHLIWDSWKEGVPAMITGMLSATVAWSGREALLGLLGVA